MDYSCILANSSFVYLLPFGPTVSFLFMLHNVKPLRVR